MKRYLLLLVSLLGCAVAPKPTATVSPLLPPPTYVEVSHGNSVWLYRDSLHGYGSYLKYYVDTLTAVYKLPPFNPPLLYSVGEIPPPHKPECTDKPLRLPPMPNIALAETDTDAIDVLIRHIEELRRSITQHNRQLCKP